METKKRNIKSVYKNKTNSVNKYKKTNKKTLKRHIGGGDIDVEVYYKLGLFNKFYGSKHKDTSPKEIKLDEIKKVPYFNFKKTGIYKIELNMLCNSNTTISSKSYTTIPSKVINIGGGLYTKRSILSDIKNIKIYPTKFDDLNCLVGINDSMKILIEVIISEKHEMILKQTKIYFPFIIKIK